MAERGRPRRFDRAQVLDYALSAFWRNGYEATSMSDLVEMMGINSPSIYAAYGSKEDLFCEAMQRYRTHYAASLLDALNNAPNAATGLAAMFDAAIELFTRPGQPRGCFIVMAAGGNAPATVAIQEELSRLRRERSDEIAARIERDDTENLIRSGVAIRPLADMYAAILQGISIAARDGMSKQRLSDLYRPSLTLLAR